jgi:hypothetical protein
MTIESYAPGPPIVTPDNASADTLELYGYLPQFVRDNDAANKYTFLSWLEGICSQQQKIDDLCRDTTYGPGWSVIMDVGRCPTYALPWLAQFVGVNIPGEIKNNDLAMRQAILAKNSFARGSLAGIVNGILLILGPDSIVNVIERYPDPYSLTIQYVENNGSLTYGELAIQYPWYTNAGGTPSVGGSFATYANFPVPTLQSTSNEIQSLIPGGLVATIQDVG